MTERDVVQALREVAKRATCPSRRAGALLLTASGVELRGYEGAPHGIMHCDVLGCLVTAGGCQHAVRAELNAILRCARRAESSVGATLFVSEPLDPAAVGAVINAGISRVVCPRPVRRGVKANLAMANIALEET